MKDVVAEVREAIRSKDRIGAMTVVVRGVLDLLSRMAEVGKEAGKALPKVSHFSKVVEVKAGKAHRMSRKGRDRIAAAQRRRWAAFRKAKAEKAKA